MSANSNSSDLQTILTQIRDIRDSNKKLDEILQTTNIVDGNVITVGEEVSNNLKEMEERLDRKVKESIQPIMEKISSLEAKIDELLEGRNNAASPFTTPPCAKRRKIARNSDLSVRFN